MRRIPALALAALLGTLVPGPSAAAAPGQIEVRLADAPVSNAGRRAVADSLRYVVETVAAGSGLTRTLAVANRTGSRQRVTLYPGAARLGTDGFSFAPGRTANPLTSWTGVAPGVLDLAPDEERTVQVRVSVPRDAPGGAHHAVVWAEVQSAGGTTGVRVAHRVGMRLYVTVGQDRSGAAGTDATPDPAKGLGATSERSRASDAGANSLPARPGGGLPAMTVAALVALAGVALAASLVLGARRHRRLRT
jgi:hypothetical protein